MALNPKLEFRNPKEAPSAKMAQCESEVGGARDAGSLTTTSTGTIPGMAKKVEAGQTVGGAEKRSCKPAGNALY
jgi:hypothetical protein